MQMSCLLFVSKKKYMEMYTNTIQNGYYIVKEHKKDCVSEA